MIDGVGYSGYGGGWRDPRVMIAFVADLVRREPISTTLPSLRAEAARVLAFLDDVVRGARAWDATTWDAATFLANDLRKRYSTDNHGHVLATAVRCVGNAHKIDELARYVTALSRSEVVDIETKWRLADAHPNLDPASDTFLAVYETWRIDPARAQDILNDLDAEAGA